MTAHRARNLGLSAVAVGLGVWGVVSSDPALLVAGAGLLGTPGILSFASEDSKDSDE